MFFILRGEEQKPPQITTGEFPFVVEYEMNGKKHFYITDFLYIPYNLIIEVKDGVYHVTGEWIKRAAGGVYFDDWGGIYIGGTPVIKDNCINFFTKEKAALPEVLASGEYLVFVEN